MPIVLEIEISRKVTIPFLEPLQAREAAVIDRLSTERLLERDMGRPATRCVEHISLVRRPTVVESAFVLAVGGPKQDRDGRVKLPEEDA
jgi:hypothetical protein